MQGFLGNMFSGNLGRPQYPKQPVQHMQAPEHFQQGQQPQFQWGQGGQAWGGQGMFQQPQGMFQQGQNQSMFPQQGQRPQFGSFQNPNMNWGGGSPDFDESNGFNRRNPWGGW